MTSASSGRVQMMAFVSGMTEETKRVRVSRTWGTATMLAPSAVWTRRGREPLRDPAASGVHSCRARPRKASTSSATARWRRSWAPRRPSWLSWLGLAQLVRAGDAAGEGRLDGSLDLDAEGYSSIHGVVSFANFLGPLWSLRRLHSSSGLRTPPTSFGGPTCRGARARGSVPCWDAVLECAALGSRIAADPSQERVMSLSPGLGAPGFFPRRGTPRRDRPDPDAEPAWLAAEGRRRPRVASRRTRCQSGRGCGKISP